MIGKAVVSSSTASDSDCVDELGGWGARGDGVVVALPREDVILGLFDADARAEFPGGREKRRVGTRGSGRGGVAFRELPGGLQRGDDVVLASDLSEGLLII